MIAPNVLMLDSGCVWGGPLTAVRLDDGRVFQVPSRFLPPAEADQHLATGVAKARLIGSALERGVNDDDILPLVEFSREHGFAMRFIEYMDVGNANNWTSEKLVSILGCWARLAKNDRRISSCLETIKK